MRRPAAVAALVLALAGCGTAAPAPAAPPPSTAVPGSAVPSSAVPGSAAPGSAGPAGPPDGVVCADYRDRESLLRQTAEAVERMPVLPAGVSLVLLGVRQTALTPGVQDPALAAAQAELVAAIDDLDAQGRRLIGPEGNAAQDAVQLDAARLLDALDAVERICGAPAS